MLRFGIVLGGTALSVVLLQASAALAQEAPPAAEPLPAAEPPPTPPAPPASPAPRAPPEPQPAPPAVKPAAVELTPLGYIEGYYAYNFNRPSNGITNERGFDNRHNSFSLTNAALGANWTAGPVGGRVVLQVGSQPALTYLSEPTHLGTPGANGSNGDLWKYLQEAFLTYKAPIGRGLLLQLGLCASPIGIEYLAVKDNWNWSRSNLFFGLPYYHTGLRATYELDAQWAATVSVFNGWNSIVDNNEEKSVQSQINYKGDQLQGQVLYFGGVERSTGAPEGPWWRHHFNATGQYDVTTFLSFAAEADYGWEPNRFGTADWYGGALYARVKPVDGVYVALRGDRFYEDLAMQGGASSTPLYWGGVKWVSSGTATIDVRPVEHLSVRLEYRHDQADGPLFFRSNVVGDGSAAAPFLANANSQDTLLLGATAWFGPP